jgi:membrane-associated phospholipid phosphatase
MKLMNFLTDFADQAVVLPIVLAVALVLAVLGWWRGALAWLAAIGMTFVAILVLKLGFMACEPVFGPWALRSPSGHTAAAAVVAGGLAALLSGRILIVLSVAALAAASVGATRVVLGLHSVPEVVLAAVVGIAGAAGLSWLAGSPPMRRPVPLLAVAAALAVLLHGARLPAEGAIWRASQGALNFVPACRAEAYVRP